MEMVTQDMAMLDAVAVISQRADHSHSKRLDLSNVAPGWYFNVGYFPSH